MRVIIEVTHISAIITLIGIIAVSRSENMGSWDQRCIGDWNWLGFIDPFITKNIDSLSTNTNACIESGFVYEPCLLTTPCCYMPITRLTKARISIIEITASPNSTIVIFGTLEYTIFYLPPISEKL